MKRLFVLFSLLFAFSAVAATTFTEPTVARVRVSKAASTTGSEAAPAGNVGLDLFDIGGMAVYLETGGATSAGVLLAYVMNPATGIWMRIPDLDLIVPASVTSYSWPGVPVPSPFGRVAFVPSGLGAIVVNVYVEGALTRR
jgi:hypothetical protein